MKGKIILLEGADGTGKSTLAKQIIEKYKASYIHLTRPKNKETEQYERIIKVAEEISNLGYHVIIDRHIISHYIYQSVFEKDVFGKDLDINRMLDKIDKIIICTLDKEIYLNSFEKLKNKRDEIYTEMSEVYDFYEIFANDNKLVIGDIKQYTFREIFYNNWKKIIKYNYMKNNSDEFIIKLMDE